MENMVKNILVIGATGFIGSNLVKLLLDKGFNIYVFIRSNSITGTKRLDNLKNINRIICTLEEFIDNADKLPEFDICYNLAAYYIDDKNLNEMVDGNINFLLSIIEFCSKNKTKLLINTGTCFEYGFNNGELLNEESKILPHSIYGASKASAVIMGNTYARLKNINMITLRLFGVYGPNENLNKFIPAIIDASLKNKNIYLTECTQIRDYMYVEDVVDIYYRVAFCKNIVNYEVYNICTSCRCSLKEIVDIIAKISNCNYDIFKFGKLEFRNNEVMNFIGDNTKLKSILDWEPRYTLEEGLRKTYDWYRKNL